MKEKHKRKVLNEEKGITLVALVVTIIVLLILAGVTIRLVLDNNGIIKRARDTSVIWENTTKNEEEIMRKLESDIDTLPEGDNNKSGGTSLKVGTTDLSTVTDISTMYGQEVDYKSVSHPNITWQLFYVDNTNYYVIASDYVANSELPCSGVTIGDTTYGSNDLKKGESTEKEYAIYGASFSTNTDYNDYVMASSVHSTGKNSNAITSNPITNTYLKWVNSSVATISDNPNMKATAYMMDTNKWSSFADGIDSAFAMGGPTLEMFVLSYNAKHSNSQFEPYQSIDENNANENGYRVKDGEYWSDYAEGLDTADASTGSGGNMWVRTSDVKAYGYWLATPSCWFDNGRLNLITYYGGIDNNDAWCPNYGFRPLVAIPKS